MSEITPYLGDRLAQARALAGLTDEALRVRAITAARDKSFEDLWSLTLAYLSSDTSAGVKLSPHTLRAYRKGVEYLLKTQTAEGAWLVPTRSKPVQRFFDNGDPGGKDQFISFAATGWAVQAMLECVPVR